MQKVLTGVLLNFDLFTSLHLQTLAGCQANAHQAGYSQKERLWNPDLLCRFLDCRFLHKGFSCPGRRHSCCGLTVLQ